MKLKSVVTSLALMATASVASAADLPTYTPENQMNLPVNYREWVFLTASVDLNYDEPIPGAALLGRHSMLDNVFVNPEAYQAFMKTGTWPDKTIMVKENRMAESAGSISKAGKYQGAVMSMELHVKDEAKFPGKWAFFVSDGKAPGKIMPQTASCFTCHGDHGAVDTTFVQFYPTLMAVAQAKGTLSPVYLKNEPKK